MRVCVCVCVCVCVSDVCSACQWITVHLSTGGNIHKAYVPAGTHVYLQVMLCSPSLVSMHCSLPYFLASGPRPCASALEKLLPGPSSASTAHYTHVYAYLYNLGDRQANFHGESVVGGLSRGRCHLREHIAYTLLHMLLHRHFRTAPLDRKLR
jgi:hypothetical protein